MYQYVSREKKGKNTGYHIAHFDQFKLKSSCTQWTFGRSVEVLKIRLRWTREGEFWWESPYEYPWRRFTLWWKTLQHCTKSMGLQPAPKRKTDFAIVLPSSVFSSFFSTYIDGDFASDKCSFLRNDYKIPRKSFPRHDVRDNWIPLLPFWHRANRKVSLLRGNGDGNKNALSFQLDRNISYRV